MNNISTVICLHKKARLSDTYFSSLMCKAPLLTLGLQDCKGGSG